MLTTRHTVLVVVDIQGKLADIVHESDFMQKNVEILAQGCRVLDIPILATEQYPQGLGHTTERIMQHLEGVPVIEKSAFSCCGEPLFEQRLMELHKTDVILCGIEAHVCVYQTARDLVGLGYNVHLVTDAVSSRTPANRELGIRKMESIGVKLTSTEMLLFELLQHSGTDEFKTISKLVK
jgi:nicotinamidase-related amidase